MYKLPTALVVIGFVFIIGAVGIGWFIFPMALENKILEKVRLENGTDTWESWSDVRVPVLFKIYLFNVTNPEEVTVGARPNLQQLGPYTFEEKRDKVNISINTERDTVKYRQPVMYYFRKDLTNGDENDVVTMLNIPLYGIAKQVVNPSFIKRTLLNLYAQRFKEKAFIQRTVKEMLFDGYRQDMLAELSGLLGKELIPNNRFGLMYGKNGSDDGEFEVFSGIRNSNDFGKVRSWNGLTSLPYWGDKYCNAINGTDGSIFSPDFQMVRDRILRLFSPDLCRSLYLTYERDIEYLGIPGYRFTIPKDLLEDSKVNPDNQCFCPNSTDCPKAGAIQLSFCKKDAPIVASTPHFLDGDFEYVNSSIGLNPVRADHETFIELEPNTGLVLRASKRIQINIDLRPTNTFGQFSKVPRMYLPVMYGDESAALTEEKAEDLRTKLFLPMEIVKFGKLIVLGIGCALICAGICIFVALKAKKEQEEKV